MNDIREDLKAFIDDELTPERAAEVQAAIDQDPALREEYLFMKLLGGEIKSAAKEPQVAGLDKAVGKTVKSGLGFNIGQWSKYAGYGVGAVMLIGLVGSFLFPVFAQSKMAAKKTAAAASLKDTGRVGLQETQPNNGGFGFESEGGTGAASPSSGLPDVEKSEQGVSGGGGVFRGRPGDGVDQGLSNSTGKLKAKRLELNKSANPAESWYYDRATTAPGPAGGVSREPLVIRTADMGIKVKDVSKAMSDTEIQVGAMGGFVENTNFNQADDDSKGLMTFQVPEKNFNAIVEYLGKAGTIISNNKTGQNVTGEVAYTDGRVRSLADEERNLIEELQRTKNSGDRLEIRSRLSTVRQEMEGLKEQNKATRDLAEMSRFSVSFEKSGQLDQTDPGDWFGQTTQGAGNVLGFFGRIFGVGLIYTVFMAPVWLPIAFGVWWLKKRAKATAA